MFARLFVQTEFPLKLFWRLSAWVPGSWQLALVLVLALLITKACHFFFRRVVVLQSTRGMVKGKLNSQLRLW